jgi:hypothetical protein
MRVDVLFPDGQICEMSCVKGVLSFYDNEETHGGWYKMFDSVKEAEDTGCVVIETHEIKGCKHPRVERRSFNKSYVVVCLDCGELTTFTELKTLWFPGKILGWSKPLGAVKAHFFDGDCSLGGALSTCGKYKYEGEELKPGTERGKCFECERSLVKK